MQCQISIDNDLEPHLNVISEGVRHSEKHVSVSKTKQIKKSSQIKHQFERIPSLEFLEIQSVTKDCYFISGCSSFPQTLRDVAKSFRFCTTILDASEGLSHSTGSVAVQALPFSTVRARRPCLVAKQALDPMKIKKRVCHSSTSLLNPIAAFDWGARSAAISSSSAPGTYAQSTEKLENRKGFPSPTQTEC
jgi:hypothetical protein